jgi:DNA-binding response OmpR family regulator
LNILIVEDDDRVAGILVRGLESENHAVVRAATGAEGLRTAALRPFDLVILDLMLPDYPGIEVCGRLRASGSTVPILILSAMSDVSDRVEGLRAGADDYLVKPFALSELLARIDALARRAGERVPRRILRAGDLEMDLDAHEARRGGLAVELSAREFALLRLLIERAGKVLSRETILLAVWGQDADPLTNVVDVYISHLRTKLDGGESSRIVTVRGIGYKFVAD